MDPFSVLTGSNFMSSVSFSFFWLEPFILLWWGKATVCGDCIAADSLLSFFINSCVNNDESWLRVREMLLPKYWSIHT